MVLDGTEKVPARSEGNERPVYGDWLVLHAFSEPATLNPYKKVDYGSHRILENMFEPLLYRENAPPYQFKGKLAVAYPAGFHGQAFIYIRHSERRPFFG